MCDTASKMIKMVINSDGLVQYLEKLELLLLAFAVHRRGRPKANIALDDSVTRLKSINDFLSKCVTKVRNFTKEARDLQGPDGVNSK